MPILDYQRLDMKLDDFKERYDYVCYKEKVIKEEIERLNKYAIGANKKVQEFLVSVGSTPLKIRTTLAELIRRLNWIIKK